MPEVGEVVGVYRLEGLLGAGGMGRVFRARHVLLGRAVALKVLDEKLAADEQYVSRFFQEARVVNEIRHPNIIDVVDFIAVKEPRVVAYVMELLDGVGLGELLVPGGIRPVQAINAGLQIASALQAVHAVNVIHRDLKPDNIFVLRLADRNWSTIPSVKILDFGIAKFENRAVEHRTKSGIMIGTPAYMAPEQIWGETITAQADIYAFGEILFEMFSGQRLFSGPTTEMMKRKASGAYEKDVELPEGLPARAQLTELVRSCVSMSAKNRPSLEEIVRALAEASKALPEGAQAAAAFAETAALPRAASLPRGVPGPITRPERPQGAETPVPGGLSSHARRRVPGPMLAAGAVLGVMLAGGGIYLRMQERVETAPIVEERAPAPAKAQPQKGAVPFTTVPVESDPAKAELWDVDRNERIGVTPVGVSLAEPSSTRTIEVRLEGYEPRRVTVDATNDRVHLGLVPTARKLAEKSLSKDSLKGASKGVSGQGSTEAPKRASTDTSRGASEQGSTEVSKRASTDASKGASGQGSTEVSKRASTDASKGASGQASSDASKSASKDTSKGGSKDAPKGASNNSSKTQPVKPLRKDETTSW